MVNDSFSGDRAVPAQKHARIPQPTKTPILECDRDSEPAGFRRQIVAQPEMRKPDPMRCCLLLTIGASAEPQWHMEHAARLVAKGCIATDTDPAKKNAANIMAFHSVKAEIDPSIDRCASIKSYGQGRDRSSHRARAFC
jgi:hypothetical protein